MENLPVLLFICRFHILLQLVWWLLGWGCYLLAIWWRQNHPEQLWTPWTLLVWNWWSSSFCCIYNPGLKISKLQKNIMKLRQVHSLCQSTASVLGAPNIFQSIYSLHQPSNLTKMIQCPVFIEILWSSQMSASFLQNRQTVVWCSFTQCIYKMEWIKQTDMSFVF